MRRSLVPALLGGQLALSSALLACATESCDGGETETFHGSDAGPEGTVCTTPFAGDPTKEPTIEAIVLGPDQKSTPIADGGSVPLIFPPQGGRVIFAGVRATNIDPCGVELSGVLRDVSTQQIRLDTRTVNLKPAGDAWVASTDADISSFANIAVCPNQWSTTNVYGTNYQLSLKLTDSAARTASASLLVVPSCAEPDREAECLCICKGGYELGESCDGGTDAGAEGSSP